MEHFLVVEDEQVMAKNIAFFLEKEGYQVDVAYDGEAALTLYTSKAYHLILLDWTLPKLDGLEIMFIRGNFCMNRFGENWHTTMIVRWMLQSAVCEKSYWSFQGKNSFMQ